jgi:hypothetical protein
VLLICLAVRLCCSFAQRDDVNWIAFEKLTSDNLFPEIHWEAVIPLLKIEAKYMETQESSSTSVDLSDQFTSLQRRCADALIAYGSICCANEEIMDYAVRENPKLLGLLYKRQATTSLGQNAGEIGGLQLAAATVRAAAEPAATSSSSGFVLKKKAKRRFPSRPMPYGM